MTIDNYVFMSLYPRQKKKKEKEVRKLVRINKVHLIMSQSFVIYQTDLTKILCIRGYKG